MQKWKRKDLPAIRRSMANPGQGGAPCQTCTLRFPSVNSNRYFSCFSTDELDKLITDRPESCRHKAMEPVITRLPGCPTGLSLPIPAQVQPPPVVTLSLPCLPLHEHHHLQAQLQAQSRLGPMSPAHAQTPPLHTLPDLCHSPLTQQPGKPPDDFYGVQGDTHTEVDVLDPSIMDFALQGE